MKKEEKRRVKVGGAKLGRAGKQNKQAFLAIDTL